MSESLLDLAIAEIERRDRIRTIKEECEADFLNFMRTFWHILEPETPLVEGWPLEQMCDLLMAIADGHINRVIINVPPGFSKSLSLNVFWVAWIWGPLNRPAERFISASYSAHLTERDNAKLARLITSTDYQSIWGDRFRLTKDGVGKLENDKTGSKFATSVGGTVTGERADFLLIDDANNPASVESALVRQGTVRWLREVMPSRLNNIKTGTIICLQQRTHEEDATGTLADHGYHWWVVPMEFDPLRFNPVPIRWDEVGDPIQVLIDPRGVDDDGNQLEGVYFDDRGIARVRMGSPMAQRDGELAWPERFPREAVDGLKKILGPYAYAGQYLQSPTARGGGIIQRDWWLRWDKPVFPDLGTVIASLDTAIKEGEENDYNALTVWGAFPGETGEPKVILTAAWRRRCSLAELVTRVAEICSDKKVDYLIIEDKARGHDVAAEIQRQYVEAPWVTQLIPANGRGAFSGDKVARLQAIAPMFSGDVYKDPVTGMDIWAGGMVYEPGKDWSEEVINEVSMFPHSAHDDYVDTISMAFAFMRRHGVTLRKVEYDRSERDKALYRRRPGLPYAIRSGDQE